MVMQDNIFKVKSFEVIQEICENPLPQHNFYLGYSYGTYIAR